jgi:hypothetical protein
MATLVHVNALLIKGTDAYESFCVMLGKLYNKFIFNLFI